LFETSGFSMWPFLRGREKLLIKKVPVEDLKIGDIILYEKDTQKICHRLVKKKNGREGVSLFVRGDNAPYSSERVTEQMYSGKAVGILNKGRTFDLTSRRSRFINRTIVFAAPIISAGNRIIRRLIPLPFKKEDICNG